MKRRTLLKWIGGVVVLCVLVPVAVPLLVSANFLKTQLAAQVKQATGRDLVIKGNASLTLLPTIGISVEDVTLGNSAGFSAPYLVHIGKLNTGAALVPLFSGVLNITGVTLEEATLYLEQNAHGAKNWEFPSAASAAPATKTAESTSPLSGFSIGDVVIKHSAVNYQKPGAKPLAVSDISLTLSGVDGRGKLVLDGAVTYQKAPVSLKIAIAEPKPFLAGKSSALSVTLEVPETKLTFDGTASQGAAIAMDGALSASVGDLPKLLSWATGKAASARPKQIDLKSTLAMRGMDSIALNKLALTVDALKAEGALVLNLAQAVPSVKGALTIPLLDLDALGGEKGEASPAVSATAPSQGWSTAPLDASALRAATANLDLTIGRLTSGKVEVRDIASNLALNAGALKLTLTRAALYGGSAKGTVGLDGSGAGLGLAANVTLSDIKVAPLMTAVSGLSRVEGKTQMALVLSGRGASERALVQSLSSNGSFKVNDGAIRGINIAQFLRNAKKGFLFGDDRQETTDFTELSATYTIAQGLVTNKDLAMKSPTLRLTGNGTVDLPARSVNYRLVPSIVGTLKGQGGKDTLGTGLTVPLVISGAWANPSVMPDLAGAVTESLKNPEALKQNLKDIKQQFKGLNSPKDIGRALFGGQKMDVTPPAADAPVLTPAPTPVDPAQKELNGLLEKLGK